MIEGEYSGYSVKVDFSFIGCIDKIETENKAAESNYMDLNIGNTIIKHDESHNALKPKSNGDGVGAVTSQNKDILMNASYDNFLYLVHEIMHTLGAKDFPINNHGIMAYPPENINNQDVTRIVNSPFCPIIKQVKQ